MVQISDNFEQLTDLDPVLTAIFYQQYEAIPVSSQAVYGIFPSDKAKETDLRVGSFSDPVAFEGSVEYDDAAPDYEIEYEHTQYAKGFTVERTLFDDMQYPNIFASASDLATAFARKREKDRWSVFLNAFATNTGYDAKVLCANDHPRSETDSTSVDNLGTAALTHQALEDAIVQLMGLKDDIGEEITIVPDLLVVPRALKKTAHELVGSELTPESANNAINVHNGFQYVVVPYLTDSTQWFVVDSVMSKRYLKWFDRIPTEFSADSEDFNTMHRRYKGYMRYSYGWSDFRWLVGNNPA